MSLRVYNTLTRTKEPFETVAQGRVGIYLCGPTVYKPSHIGHMVGPVIFDCIKRYLTYSGYKVTLVVNITDVDDKLIVESARRGMPMAELADEMTRDYFRNLEAMEIDTIDHFPKATDHIDEIVRFTGDLVAKGFAYVSEGDVYFDVAKDSQYGKLSGRSTDALVGEGGEMAGRKRTPGDFALWKAAKPGEPSWASPWGPGRPGWHIECSAMSRRLLGETFDIHGGGLDLVFPHHENEIAQSECCHGRPMARYWLHNGLMQASNEVGKVGGRQSRELDAGDQAAQEAGKLGKSKGASAFRELLETVPGETVRFFILSTHYRRPIDFSLERIEETHRGLEAFYRFFARFERATDSSFYQVEAARLRSEGDFAPGSDELARETHALRERFLETMDDDFNTGGAVGVLFDLLRALNRYVDANGLESQGGGAERAAKLAALARGAAVLRELTATLGLFRTPAAAPALDDALTGKLVELLVRYRAEARAARNFALADAIRKDLAALGIVLEDRPTGTQWTRPKS